MNDDTPDTGGLAAHAGLTARIADHPLYAALNTVADLRVFMEHHVYAVWDFMSLIKALQARLAPATVPWLPPRHPRAARFINRLVMEEESDHSLEHPGVERFASHFAGYCAAMDEIGADRRRVMRFIERVEAQGVADALLTADIPMPARHFMTFTFDRIGEGQAHRLAAVLAFGRESLVPRMFQSILDRLGVGPADAPVLHSYLQRHIELDGGEHAALAARLVDDLCGTSAVRTNEARDAVGLALRTRLAFWDGVHAAVLGRAGRQACA